MIESLEHVFCHVGLIFSFINIEIGSSKASMGDGLGARVSDEGLSELGASFDAASRLAAGMSVRQRKY